MLRVGLTGGYATGKSSVAKELERLGCHVIYADHLGHQVLEPPGEAYAPTVAAFGSAILDAEGRIDRKKLAGIVFGFPEKLEMLNGFVHPAVFRAEERLIADWTKLDPDGIIVVEAAILIETGRYRIFDRLLLTTCSPELQIQRALARDGTTREQVLQRLARQLPFADKQALADYVIDTSGTKEATARQVEEIFRDLQAARPTAKEE